MANRELAKIFFEIADFLEADRVSFKPYAYRRAGLVLQGMEEDVAAIYGKGGAKALEEIPGIGASIALKIEEYLKGGEIAYYRELKKRLPVNLEELIQVEGLGPRRARVLYEKLGIRSLKGLEAAAAAHKIAGLPGFGPKTEANLLEGVAFQRMSRGRFLLGEIMPTAREMKTELEKLPEIEKVEIAGSLARRKETIGDVDFLAVLKPGLGAAGAERAADSFIRIAGAGKIWGKGGTKVSVRTKSGFDMDLRIVPAASYGAARQYFTGSKEHNVALRQIAKSKGLKLSEYGLFSGKKMIAGDDERRIYERLGLRWIPPEMREDLGEIEAARSGKLPELIGYGGLKGDLHCHSNYSDGRATIEDVARAAIMMGYEYAGIADHTKSLKIVRSLDEAGLEKRNAAIDELNAGFRARGINFTLLKGCEANIMDDGSIDIEEEALRRLDFVIAGVHTNFHFDQEKMTRRIIRAMENPNVDIISHPTGRLIKKREAYLVDMEEIFAVARRTKTVLEINSQPMRLDLNSANIREGLKRGVKMVINTDAHDAGQLQFAEFGIAQARRGWAKASDIVNTQTLGSLRESLKK